MSYTGLSPVQQALYAAWSADATLMSMIDGVFDDVPDGALAKYIVIGDGTETPFRTFGKNGHEDAVTVHVWTRDDAGSAGYKTALAIIERMTAVIEGQALAVGGHSTVMANYEGCETLRSRDQATGVTWRHVPTRYRIIIQDAP